MLTYSFWVLYFAESGVAACMFAITGVAGRLIYTSLKERM